MKALFASAAAVALLSGTAQANLITVDFSQGSDGSNLVNQQIVNSNHGVGNASTYDVFKYDGSNANTAQFLNMTISADNTDRNGGTENYKDMALIFDSDPNASNTSDDDLHTPASKGNLQGQDLGNLLIIQENGRVYNGHNKVRNWANDDYQVADDEGSRPAGYFSIEFDADNQLQGFDGIRQFGFDLIDIEGASEWNTPEEAGIDVDNYNGTGQAMTGTQLTNLLKSETISGLMGAFVDENDEIVEFITFDSLDGSTQGEGTVQFGNNSANRIDPLAFDQGVYEVIISLGGSGAIDNLVFSAEPPGTFAVPEPSTFLLLGTGLVGLIGYHRRQRQA